MRRGMEQQDASRNEIVHLPALACSGGRATDARFNLAPDID